MARQTFLLLVSNRFIRDVYYGLFCVHAFAFEVKQKVNFPPKEDQSKLIVFRHLLHMAIRDIKVAYCHLWSDNLYQPF